LPTSDCTKVFGKFVLAAAVVVDFAGVWVFAVADGLTLQQAASSR
jgi:Kef-type K+ transport system membrane component KefB